MNLKNIISRIAVVAVLTVMVGFQSANAQATTTDKASVEKAKSTTEQVLPGERHPEDIAIDKKMTAQGIQPTRTSSSSTMPERHPEDVAIDKKMAAQGIQQTRTSSSSAVPERHPEDVAIDKKMAAENPTTAQPQKAKVAPLDPTIYAPDGSLLIPASAVSKATSTTVSTSSDLNEDGIPDKPHPVKEQVKRTVTDKASVDTDGNGNIEQKEN